MNKPSATRPADLPAAREGAHEKKPDETIRSRSADPGQSSYGGFKGEDPRRQVEDLSPGDAAQGGQDKPRK
ncbi:hypothetical protein CAL12_03910 [Bordetella genomosp. 8]|uniref:Uncharacterized protein n=1 Tax=Bordetella genomosp. 8 TaxID=1416806 RepID=A0A1W6YHP4_9BORD|nr:hypothetical protein [Bordetella genomosp. 8]ARP80053.1 hypothetical protein CAL12_03910 [Bordetella genomosp. 8]